MHLHANLPGLIFAMSILTALMFLPAYPYASPSLWDAFIDMLEQHKAKRRAMQSRARDDRLKKYRVIDMRKLR